MFFPINKNHILKTMPDRNKYAVTLCTSILKDAFVFLYKTMHGHTGISCSPVLECKLFGLRTGRDTMAARLT